MNPTLYDTDYYLWTERQVQALRDRNLDELDLDNLAEEIELLGNEVLRAVNKNLMHLIEHQLKVDYCAHPYYLNGWLKEIRNFRDEVNDRLTNSIKAKIDLEKQYQRAKREVTSEYNVKLPEKCPYSLDKLL